MSRQLQPGFRFHPTDEELVSYYLKRKNYGKKIEFEAIGTIDLYKYEPWDLPDKSLLKTRDLEWYFFNPRDRKFANSSRANRATEKGYWKATGKDRSIMSNSKHVGMKKTLVFYRGRAPKGDRTNWVMHEYRLNDVDCERLHGCQNNYVLCRIFQKSGLGSRNGEQYGAPVEDCDDLEENKHSHLADPENIISDGSLLNYTIFDEENHIETKQWIIEDSCGIKSESLNSSAQTELSGGENNAGTRDRYSVESEESILQELYQLVASNIGNDGNAGVCMTSLDTKDSRNADFLDLDELFPISNEDENRNKMSEFSKFSVRLPESSGCGGCQQENVVETSQWIKEGTLIKSGGLSNTVMTESSGAECITGTGNVPSLESEERIFEELYQLVSSCSANDGNADVCSVNPPVSNEDFLEMDDLFQDSNEGKNVNKVYEEFPELLSNLHRQKQSTEYGDFPPANIQWNAQELRTVLDPVHYHHDRNHNSTVLQRSLIPPEKSAGTCHQFATTGNLENTEKLEYFEALDGLFVEETGFLDVGLAENVQSSFLESVGLEEPDTSFKDAQQFLTMQSFQDVTSESHMRNIEYVAPRQNKDPTISENDINQQNLQEIGRLLADTGQQRTLMSAILKYLANLPSFPASAADLPSQEVLPSEHVKCKKETFVRQLSIRAAEQKLGQGSTVGFFMLASLVVIWAIFWLLIAGSAWKLADGVCKFIHSSTLRD